MKEKTIRVLRTIVVVEFTLIVNLIGAWAIIKFLDYKFPTLG